MKKVLIFYTSVGLGHKVIAENIAFDLKQAGFEVLLKDVLEVQKGKLVSFGKSLYHFILTKIPFVWRFLHNSKMFVRLTLPLRYKVAGKNYLRAKAEIEKYQPDCVITTQATASALIALMKKRGEYKKLFGIAFSDYHFHPYWVYKEADFYLANIEEQKQEMLKLGVAPEKIYICGMTLMPQILVDKQKVREDLSIKPEEKVILVGSGSMGLENNSEILEELKNWINTKVLVLCGKNEENRKFLAMKYVGANIMPLAFFSPMEKLYAIADIFLTKPGGLTTAEALRFDLPMIITHCLPGGEEINLEFLAKRGLALESSSDIIKIMKDELQTGAFKQSLSLNASKRLILYPEICPSKVLLKQFDEI